MVTGLPGGKAAEAGVKDVWSNTPSWGNFTFTFFMPKHPSLCNHVYRKVTIL
jgi:hypothetical protein